MRVSHEHPEWGLAVLDAIYLINDSGSDLVCQWLDQVIAVAETAATYALAVVDGLPDEDATRFAADHWSSRGDESDHEGLAAAMEFGQELVVLLENRLARAPVKTGASPTNGLAG